MNDSRPDDRSHRSPLALVIPLSRSSVPDAATPRTTFARGVDLLQRRFGDRWPELPNDLGRRAASAESLLVSGPTAIDPLTAAALDVAGGASVVLRAALALTDQVRDDAEVLSEALRADLLGMSLGQLDTVVGATLDLALGPRVQPAWASPAAANDAHVVLDAHSVQLRRINDLHVALYARFTDLVLDIPAPLLQTGSRPWRLLARRRLSQALAAASRSGAVPGGRRAAAREVLDVHDARAVLATMTPLLTRSLGRTSFGPLTDVDAIAKSLSAVRRFQLAMGDHLDAERLAELLAADAFRSPYLAGPATRLRTALNAWRTGGAPFCAGDPWGLPAEELATWALSTMAVLPAIATGAQAVIEVGQRPTSLRVLVDDLLLRENVAELATRLDGHEADPRKGRARESGSAS